jgi:hypothetical protein
MRNVAVLPWVEIYLGIHMEVRKPSVRTGGAPTEVSSRHLPTTNEKRHRFSQLARGNKQFSFVTLLLHSWELARWYHAENSSLQWWFLFWYHSGARPHTWGRLFFNVCLNSRRWFVLCLVFIPYLVLVQVSGDIDWAQLSRVYLKTETESRLRNFVLNKNRTMDNVQKHNICTNVPSSQTFRP